MAYRWKEVTREAYRMEDFPPESYWEAKERANGIREEPRTCSTCGEDYALPGGRCRRCMASIEEERFWRESGR